MGLNFKKTEQTIQNSAAGGRRYRAGEKLPQIFRAQKRLKGVRLVRDELGVWRIRIGEENHRT